VPELAKVRDKRSDRWIHLVLGTRRVTGRAAVTAIIATMEGRKIVHVRRVHSR
jgi:hypothetical protein